jgi:hypothetical protein
VRWAIRGAILLLLSTAQDTNRWHGDSIDSDWANASYGHLGQMVGDSVGCVLPFYSLMRRRALQRCTESTIRTIDALSRYCQGVVARDMQPHNLRDLMLGQKSLGTESLHRHFVKPVRTSTSTSQSYHQHRGIRRPTRERMADHSAPHGMFLQQENLIKQQMV